MNPFVAGLLGAATGAGIWVALTALVPAKPDLRSVLEALTAEPDPRLSGTDAPAGRASVLAARLGLPREAIRADLAALERTSDQYMARLARTTAIAAAVPVLLAVLAGIAGTGLHPLVVAAAAVGFAFIAWAAVDAETHAGAEHARADARRALAVVLSLTAMALSGGAGVDSALRSAAATGSGEAFERIQAALDRAALLSQTPWAALAELGDRLGVDDYEQLASTVALAGTEGARIRASLTDRADALRAQRLADIETDALASTERMSLPIVALACSFVVIVGYPALEAIITGL